MIDNDARPSVVRRRRRPGRRAHPLYTLNCDEADCSLRRGSQAAIRMKDSDPVQHSQSLGRLRLSRPHLAPAPAARTARRTRESEGWTSRRPGLGWAGLRLVARQEPHDDVRPQPRAEVTHAGQGHHCGVVQLREQSFHVCVRFEIVGLAVKCRTGPRTSARSISSGRTLRSPSSRKPMCPARSRTATDSATWGNHGVVARLRSWGDQPSASCRRSAAGSCATCAALAAYCCSSSAVRPREARRRRRVQLH